MRSAIGVVGLVLASQVSAADFCVSTSAELETAQQQINAAPVGEPNTLRLVRGVYGLEDSIIGSNGALSVQGGFDVGCLNRVLGASQTIIQAADGQIDLSFHSSDSLQMSDLTISGFAAFFAFPFRDGAELHASRLAVFLGNVQGASAAEIHASTNALTFADNILVDALSTSCALTTSSPELQFVTVVNRGTGAGLCATGDSDIWNSILVSAGGSDIQSDLGDIVSIAYSVFSHVAVDLDPTSHDNSAGPVAFQNSADPFLRNQPDRTDTIAVDTGFDRANGLDVDLLGASRTVGLAPDRGAFELTDSCPIVFANGFDELCDVIPHRGHSRHRRPDCDPICS